MHDVPLTSALTIARCWPSLSTSGIVGKMKTIDGNLGGDLFASLASEMPFLVTAGGTDFAKRLVMHGERVEARSPKGDTTRRSRASVGLEVPHSVETNLSALHLEPVIEDVEGDVEATSHEDSELIARRDFVSTFQINNCLDFAPEKDTSHRRFARSSTAYERKRMACAETRSLMP